MDPLLHILGRPSPTWDEVEIKLAQAGMFAVDPKKIAGMLSECVAGGDSGSTSWLCQFEGTPLMQKALELAQAELEMEIADLQQRAERDAELDGNRDRWRQRDELRIARQQLELELFKTRSGGGTVAPPVAGSESADPRESTVKVETKAAPQPPPAAAQAPSPTEVPAAEAKTAAIGTYEQLRRSAKGEDISAKGVNAEGTLEFPTAALGDGPGRRATEEERKGLKAMPDLPAKDPEKKAESKEEKDPPLPERVREVVERTKKANVAASLLSGMARRPMMPVSAIRGAATAEGHALSSLVGRRPPPMPTSAVRPGASPFMPAPGASAGFAGRAPGPAPNLGPSRVPTGAPAPDAVEYFKRFGGSAPAAGGARTPAPAVAVAPMSQFKLAQARALWAALGGPPAGPF